MHAGHVTRQRAGVKSTETGCTGGAADPPDCLPRTSKSWRQHLLPGGTHNAEVAISSALHDADRPTIVTDEYIVFDILGVIVVSD
jgi:hypothetical protein